jgi:hypothetical protein
MMGTLCAAVTKKRVFVHIVGLLSCLSALDCRLAVSIANNFKWASWLQLLHKHVHSVLEAMSFDDSRVPAVVPEGVRIALLLLLVLRRCVRHCPEAQHDFYTYARDRAVATLLSLAFQMGDTDTTLIALNYVHEAGRGESGDLESIGASLAFVAREDAQRRRLHLSRLTAQALASSHVEHVLASVRQERVASEDAHSSAVATLQREVDTLRHQVDELVRGKADALKAQASTYARQLESLQTQCTHFESLHASDASELADTRESLRYAECVGFSI